MTTVQEIAPYLSPNCYESYILVGLKCLLNRVIESDSRGQGHSEGQPNSKGHHQAPFDIQTYLLERMKILEVKFIEIVLVILSIHFVEFVFPPGFSGCEKVKIDKIVSSKPSDILKQLRFNYLCSQHRIVLILFPVLKVTQCE